MEKLNLPPKKRYIDKWKAKIVEYKATKPPMKVANISVYMNEKKKSF